MPSNSILNIKKDGEWVEIPYLKGEDGYSPTATVVKDGNKSTLTVTDKNGTTTVDILDGEGGGTSITVDDAMSDTSTNPVQNKVIKKYIDDKCSGEGGGTGSAGK